MKANWLMTTAAAAILALTGLAGAQERSERGGKAPGAMEKSAPAQLKGAEPRKGEQQAQTIGRGNTQSVRLNVEQRTRIRQVVVSKKITKIDKVNFTVSEGAKVPRTLRFHPIPDELVEIHPAWRGHHVILVGSELVIVHPTSYEIVAVIVV